MKKWVFVHIERDSNSLKEEINYVEDMYARSAKEDVGVEQ